MTSILFLSLLLLLDLGLSMDHRNHTGMRRLVKKKKFLQHGNGGRIGNMGNVDRIGNMVNMGIMGNVDRIGYYANDVVDYNNIVEGPLTGYSYQYPEVDEEDGVLREPGERQTSEMGGVMDFLAGTKLTNMLTLSLPIPFCEFSDLCKSLKRYHPKSSNSS